MEGERWVGLVYPVCKAKEKRKGEKGVRKWNRVSELNGDIPHGALDSLRAYWLSERQEMGLLFPNAYSQYGKAFSLARKKMIALGYTSWDRSTEDYYTSLWGLKGYMYRAYDYSPYSGRRFFVSCFHWLVSAQNRNGVPDLLETQRRMAHSGSKDTQTYVHSWKSIGLLPEEIGRGWKALQGHDKDQQRLNNWW